MIEIKDVHVLFGSTLALDLESLRIEAGERVFVLGHSGSGKTTLSRLIKGRLRPTSGTVRVLGEDPASPRPRVRREIQRKVAMVDQEFFLVPRATVVANVLSGALGRVPPLRSLLGIYPQEIWERAEDILGEVELSGLEQRRVETLSGGQRQRTAIARALMQEATIIIADEPVSNLDPELAEDALQLLVDCVARRDVTLLVNLHQPELARRFASRFVGLADGRLVYDGDPAGFTRADADLVYRGSQRRQQKERNSNDSAKPMAPATSHSGIRLVRP
jgi:phosphonate transport system ATP-binding protein